MTQMLTPTVHRTPKRWTKREYNAAAERGTFHGMHVYLYRGELIQLSAMGAIHAQGIKRLTRWLTQTFGDEVRIQLPFECVDESEPEPDGCLCTAEQDARRPHPNSALMLFEICDSSLEIDREFAFDYAASGVPEYWIINVRDRQIEVYRHPVADPSSTTGHRYSHWKIHHHGESISPLVRPDISVSVATLVDIA